MAALLTVDPHYLAAEGKDARVLIKDFAGLAGPYDFTPEDRDFVEMFGPPERYPQMQATTFVEGKEPPMLLPYGERDVFVPSNNHERLAGRIREKGGLVEVITYPDLDHFGIISTFSSVGPRSRVVDDMTLFFKERGASESETKRETYGVRACAFFPSSPISLPAISGRPAPTGETAATTRRTECPSRDPSWDENLRYRFQPAPCALHPT